MVKGSGPKYANGNFKNQQTAYNETKYGTELRVKANREDRKTKKNGTGKKGDNKDNSHIGKNRTSLVAQSTNRAGLGIHKRRKPRNT